ncbi:MULTISPECIES: DUF4157 domain-containing protein [unclassified Azospirillum]|uniref:eCIS core domain-containing protein n=1 Tax=unclassified Azospirillum TaxID=2630922 RepID=UPI000B6E1A95|nr:MULTISPECIES: DUF4157 domain-containing protein [unclassified Azospirillum]SNS50897.1 Inositol polyphosphate kinase [Azospirillum sp. RU38E]SNS70730.1 Inositol polyphosphate kinase [Azospirillum sp. RU37A]
MAEYKNAASHKRTMALKSFSRHGQARLEDRRLDSSPAQLEDKRKPQGPYAGVLQKVSAATNTDLTGVKIHTNSPEPARIDAHGFTRGNEIHLAPGQEKHLPHELGHVVQQMAGKVKPTGTVNGLPINDHPALEREATEIGNKAFSASRAETSSTRPGAKPSIQRQARSQPPHRLSMANGVIQRAGTKPRAFSTDRRWVIKATSDREAFVYENANALKLNTILPKFKLLVTPEVKEGDDSLTIISENSDPITITGKRKDNEALVEAIEGKIKKIIILENIAYEEKESETEKKSNQIETWVGDIKIGNRTKSEKQYNKENDVNVPTKIKLAEHFIKDYFLRDSRKKGYDFENLSKFRKYIGRNMDKKNNIKIAASNIFSNLTKIYSTMTGPNNKITLVGSSILFVFNINTPDSSVAKLIDPDHPIILDEPKEEGKKIDEKDQIKNVPSSMIDKTDFNDNYEDFVEWFNEWKNEYGDGLKNVMEIFSTISTYPEEFVSGK